MALKEVTTGNFFKLNGMDEGATFKCYPVRVIDVVIEGRPAKNVIVVNADTGEDQTIGTPGNLKYLVNDGKLNMGEYTEITRIEDKKYGKLNGSQFKVAQDNEKTLSDQSFDAIPAADLSTAKKPASKFPNVKEAAEKLAAQAGARK
jgi:hypothetical protein